MVKKTGGRGKKGKEPLKSPDPLPGPDLLRPVLKYSEDDPVLKPNVKPVIETFEAPPEDDEQEDEPVASLGNIPAELLFGVEDLPNIDKLFALKLAEENSDDARSASSATEDLNEDREGDVVSVGSAETESESTASGSSIHSRNDLQYEFSSTDFELEGSSLSSDEVDAPSKQPVKVDSLGIPLPQKVTLKKPKPPSKTSTLWRSIKRPDRISESKENWITEKFAELLSSGAAPDLPLYLTVEDLLETNLDFERMGADVVQKLREVAEGKSGLEFSTQESQDFESPGSRPSSVDSGGQDADRTKTLPPAPLLDGDKEKEKKTAKKGTPTSKQKKPSVTELPKEPKAPKKYPAEAYDDSQRTEKPEKPFLHREKMRATQQEQDAWITESAEDINFIEYRREQLLKGASVPNSSSDFELEMIAERAGKKLLQQEAALTDRQDSGATKHVPEIVNETELPARPLLPVKINRNEDPNDQDTSSEEDELKAVDKKRILNANDHFKIKAMESHLSPSPTSTPGGGKKKVAFHPMDPYMPPKVLHEDDRYDYYNSSRSSSDFESVTEVVHKEVEAKAEKLKKKMSDVHKSENATVQLEIGGQAQQIRLPLTRSQTKRFNVDDLYALAHDLEMPPSQLRKELLAPTPETDFEPDVNEEGWRHVQSIAEYEKTPAYYAAQIEYLQSEIRDKREEWIVLELDHHDLTVKSRAQLTNLDQYMKYLTEQKGAEMSRSAKLKIELQKLKEHLDGIIQYHTATTKWLQDQKEKLREQYLTRKTSLQYKLYALRENVDKQQRMESQITDLKEEASKAKAAYTQKVSILLLESARQRSRLFRDYERKIGRVFIEYQRALILSMNDNLQAACEEHVLGRQRAKRFSDKAIRSVRAYQRVTEKLAEAQEAVNREEELLAVSKKQAHKVQHGYKVLENRGHEERKKLHRLEASVQAEEQASLKYRKWKILNKQNKSAEKQIAFLNEESQTLTTTLKLEKTKNKQIEMRLKKLRDDLEAYFTFQNSSEPKIYRRDLVEPFEDRFIRFLQYAAEIESLIASNRRPVLLREGDFGLIPQNKSKKKA